MSLNIAQLCASVDRALIMLRVRGIDDYTDSFMLLASPIPAIVISALYLLVVFKLGPKFMEQRQPYNLKIIISIYNIIQVAASIYIVYGLTNIGFTFRDTWHCVQIESVKDHNPKQRALLGWFVCIVKAVDMMDTLFFILRKSQRQITFLHVFHHVTTFLLMWLFVKFSIGYMELFIVVLNSCVHVLMYSYYFLAGFKSLTKGLSIFKPIITMIQISQLILILGHVYVALQPSCNSTPLFYVQFANIAFQIGLFCNFYRQSYFKKSA